MTTTNNSINLKDQGLAYRNTAGAFSGIDGGTANFVLQSAGTAVAPTFVKPNIFLTTSGTFTATKGRGYIVTGASTITLPSAPSTGDTVSIMCDTASNVVVTASSGQVISIQAVISNYAGTATSAAAGNAITLVYNSGDTSWIAYKVIGSWTLNTFLPSSITNGLMWVDGADPLGTGTPPTTGTNVLPVDKMGVVTFVQATSSRRPVYDSGILNSLGCLKSDTANNTLLQRTGGSAFNTTTSFVALAQPSSTTNAYFWGGSGTSDAPAIISNFGGLSYEWFNAANRYTISAGATGFNLIEVYQTDATNVQGFLNGTSVFSNVPTVALNTRIVSDIFCASSGLNISTCYFAEFFIYRAILTSAQKINIRRYIAQKWGLAIPS